MPKSKEKVIEELITLNIDYNDEMSYSELCDLLKNAEPEEPKELLKTVPSLASQEAEGTVGPEPEIKIKDVPCGVGTINDHEKRITILERKCLK